jgi:hypothetical protein
MSKNRTFLPLAQGKLLRGNVNPVDGRTLFLGLIAWFVGAAVFFRFPVLSGFQSIVGDIGDTRQMIFLHEHFFQALTGSPRFGAPPYLYPYPHVLGVADAFVLDLIPYAAFRWLGFDEFLAYQLMVIALSLLCFMAGLVLCVRYLALRPALAICAAALITFPNNLYFKVWGGHVQFFSLYYIPAIVLLALSAMEDFPRLTPWSIARIAGAAMLFALLFATSFYTAWLFALTVIIAACAFVALRTRMVVAYLEKHRKAAAILGGAAVAAFMLGLVPFALMYLPTLADVAGRSYRDYIVFAWYPQDIINVSPRNLAWGWLVSWLALKPWPEIALAVTPGMAAILVALVYVHRKRLSKSSTLPWQVAFGFCCAITWLFAWLLTFKIGTVSAFWLVREVVPGASAIRAGTRIALLVNLWTALGVAVLLQYWIDTGPAERRKWRKAMAGAAMVFCLVEQLNVIDNAQLPRGQELDELASVPTPPSQCRAFLVNRARREFIGLDDIDALGIALKVGLPTINGSTPWWPKGWLLQDRSIEYFDAAKQWIALTGLTNVCLYDRSTRQWSDFS